VAAIIAAFEHLELLSTVIVRAFISLPQWFVDDRIIRGGGCKWGE